MDFMDGLSPEERQEMLAFFESARTDLAPMIENANGGIAFLEETPSPQACLELGMLIYYDKPILTLCPVGAKLPKHLNRVSDKVVYYDPARPLDEQPLVKEQIKSFGQVHGGG